ncbi:MAG: UbiD family decarboxylase [Euryarchaeota archaeon]|nr:UbiD family decarboxylase [Euryarchaeota archaeon]
MTLLEHLVRDPIIVKDEIKSGFDITRRIILSNGRPIIFENFNGKKVISNIYSNRKFFMEYFNLSSIKELFNFIINATRSKMEVISTKTKVWRTKLSSVEEIPFFKYFPEDGGPYVTSSIIIAKKGKVTNLSYHRMMYLGDERFVIRLVPRHLYRMWRESIEHGEELRVAIVIGVMPEVALSGAISIEYGKSELEVASFMHYTRYGKPLEVYEHGGIPIPKESEYVLIGRLTENLVDEGPFVDITRTPDIVRKQPELVIDEAYASEEPIYHAILPGGHEHRILMGLPREASIYEAVSRVVPEVKNVALTQGGCSWLHAVVSIRKQHEGDGKNAIMAAFAGHPSLKHVVVVDDDIDVENPEDVEWAIATRFQADRGLVIIRNARGSTLDPSSDNGLMTKMGIDATKPLGKDKDFRNVYKDLLS